MLQIVAGWEPREAIGYQVALSSAFRKTRLPIARPMPLVEKVLRDHSLYWRPHEEKDGRMWDPISEAPLSTEFANTRFLTPWVAEGPWVLFLDFVDMIFLSDPVELFDLAEDRYAVMVVKREHVPDNTTKMDGQIQTAYPRKNWSSVILWNLEHPGTLRLTLEMVNTLPGRDLHRFCWLEDDEIGSLPLEWNHLVGVDPEGAKPKLLHFTNGLPIFAGYEEGPYAEVWRNERDIWEAFCSEPEGLPDDPH